MLRMPIAMMALVLSVSATAVAQVPGAPGAGSGGAPAPPARRSFLGRPQAAPAPPAQAPPQLSPVPSAPAAPSAPAPASSSAPVDDAVFPSQSVLPEPAALDQLESPRIALPTEPIEPYLLQRHNGPFMVLAHTFRGPDAARYAQALAMELRRDHRLPAYVWYLRIQPGQSNIRNVPPTAPDPIRSAEAVTAPERYRVYDEAAVLVGDCKSIDQSEKLLHEVKKIHSVVLDGLPSIFQWRGKSLKRAMMTTNPLVPAQELFAAREHDGHSHHGAHGAVAGAAHGGLASALNPGETFDPSVALANFQPAQKPDPLVRRMNSGPRSLYDCPGPFALQVAEFLGRSTMDENDPRLLEEGLLRQSPLAVAADEAERLADNLARCESLPPGIRPYVYHDRFASRVLVGPITSPNDPGLPKLIQTLQTDVSVELHVKKFAQMALAPANQLTPVPQD